MTSLSCLIRAVQISLAMVFALTGTAASAQTNVLIEACNGLKSATKRAECVKTVKAQTVPTTVSAPNTSSIPTAPTAQAPFSLNGAATICETVLTKLAARHLEAAIDETESTEQVMQVTWPGVDGKPPTYCGVDRESRRIVSLGKGDKAIKGAQLTKLFSDREKFERERKEMANGNYTNFVAQAKQALTKDFKDPSSVQYRGLFVSGTTLPVLCGEVNGKNSYGAYTGFKRFYTTADGMIMQIDSPKENYALEQMWPKMCGAKTTDIQE